jgi:hypothetical protein
MELKFKPRFAASIFSGKKNSTIRRVRRSADWQRAPIIGEGARCVVDLGANAAVLLGKWKIGYVGVIKFDLTGDTMAHVSLNDELLTEHDLEILANDEGFADVRDMSDWFNGHYSPGPFEGWCIAWAWTKGGRGLEAQRWIDNPYVWDLRPMPGPLDCEVGV